MATRKDSETIGLLAQLGARLRTGRWRGLGPLGAARLYEPVLKQVVEMAGIHTDDNVLILGAADLRPVEMIAPRCRMLLFVDDLPEEDLTRLEREQHAKGYGNVRFQWGRSNVIPTPQYTIDRAISLNYVYRSRIPDLVLKQMFFVSRHGSTIVCCEPAASMDGRTARKYSREAGLSMDEHRALVGYARSVAAHRGFTREGMTALLARWGFQDAEVRELLHGLVLAVKAVVRI